MLPQHEGKYLAIPAEIIVNDTGKIPKATVAIRFNVYKYLPTGAPPVDLEPTEITGYFYLEDNSGAVNTFAIEALKNALGWDGVDTEGLLEPVLTTAPVQIVVVADDYGGKRRMKVKYINPVGDARGGGIERPTPDQRQTIRDRLRAKLGHAPPQPPEPPAAASKPGDIPF